MSNVPFNFQLWLSRGEILPQKPIYLDTLPVQSLKDMHLATLPVQ